MKNKELNIGKHTPYEVDFEYLENKVEFFLEIPNEKPTKLSFWEIMKFFSEKRISNPVDGSFLDSVRIDCIDVEYIILCKNLIARQILAITLNLQNEKKSIWCDWYVYDYNSCNELPQFIHSFFLVDAGKIQANNVSLSTSWMDECDPNILVESKLVNVPDSSMPLWANMEKDQKAITLWYYQKFYQETEKGQILSIRENLKSIESAKTTMSISSIDLALLDSINKNLKWIAIILIGIFLKMVF